MELASVASSLRSHMASHHSLLDNRKMLKKLTRIQHPMLPLSWWDGWFSTALQDHSWCLRLGPSGGRSQRWWTVMSKGRLASVKPKSKLSLPEPNWEQTAFECHLKPRVSSVIVLAGCPECTLQTDSWPPALFSFCLVPGFSRRPWVWREAARFSSPIW